VPLGSLTLSGSKLFGMAYFSGSLNGGMAFSMNLDGSGYTVIHNFQPNTATDGSMPTGDLVALGSTLYGMTHAGGIIGQGSLFDMNLDGSGFQVLTSLGGDNGAASPTGDPTLSTGGLPVYGMGQGSIIMYPFPEPASAALLAFGVALCASGRRRCGAARRRGH
jgi:hypothetical protein